MKKYNLSIQEFDDNSLQIDRTNDGFNVFELIGFYSHILDSLNKQACQIDDDSVVSKLIATTSEGTFEIKDF